MAAKFVSAFIVDSSISLVYRRGYAAAATAAAQGQKVAVSGGAKSNVNVMMKKGREESTKNTSWVPDPKTGYYRPENQPKQLEAAELRDLHLKNKH